MKKHVRKIIALLLVISLFPVLPASVFAEEADGSTIPEGATRHTIELTVEPGETLDPSDDSGVSPYIWGNNSLSLNSGTVTYTGQMTIPERYFAFEAYATGSNGTAVGGSFSVTLVRYVSSGIAAISGNVDGTIYKKDWIDLGDSRDGIHFCIYNGTATTIQVTITYYSWT